jgi:hypothetical protein
MGVAIDHNPSFERIERIPQSNIPLLRKNFQWFKLLTDEIDQDKSSNYINPDPYFAPGGCVSR